MSPVPLFILLTTAPQFTGECGIFLKNVIETTKLVK